jgi:hypothetical protein
VEATASTMMLKKIILKDKGRKSILSVALKIGY